VIIRDQTLNIETANGSADARAMRDIIARRLSAAALTLAQQRAREFMESNYQNCD
jgi:hypothetical protein